MYERVRTARQQKNFDKTWEFFCDQYGWSNKSNGVDGRRYNILLKKEQFFQRKRVIGTIEFIPCTPSSMSEVPKGIYFPEIKDEILHKNKAWRIDKLCLHQSFQRKGYSQIFFQIIFEHTTESGVEFYISAVERKFFRFLKISFGSAVEKRGNAILSASTVLIPTLINANELLKRLHGKVELPLLSSKVR